MGTPKSIATIEQLCERVEQLRSNEAAATKLTATGREESISSEKTPSQPPLSSEDQTLASAGSEEEIARNATDKAWNRYAPNREATWMRMMAENKGYEMALIACEVAIQSATSALQRERDAWQRRAEGMKLGNENFERENTKLRELATEYSRKFDACEGAVGENCRTIARLEAEVGQTKEYGEFHHQKAIDTENQLQNELIEHAKTKARLATAEAALREISETGWGADSHTAALGMQEIARAALAPSSPASDCPIPGPHQPL